MRLPLSTTVAAVAVYRVAPIVFAHRRLRILRSRLLVLGRVLGVRIEFGGRLSIGRKTVNFVAFC